MLAAAGIIIQRGADGVEAVGVADVGEVEEHILRPGEFLVAADIVRHDDLPAVELVPHHAVVKAGGFFHQAAGELRLVHPGIRLHEAVHRGLAIRHDGAVVADDQIGLRFLRGLHQQARGELIVGIHKLQIFAARALDGDVARAGNAGVFLVDDDDARVEPRVHSADFQARVARAVVDEQHLEVLVTLMLDAFQTRNHVHCSVVNGHDDGDERAFHTRETSDTLNFFHGGRVDAPFGLA